MNRICLLFLMITLSLLCFPQQRADSANYRTWPGNQEISQQQFDMLDTTTVLRCEESPTGYYVTFRFNSPKAKRVRIYGEWLFSDPSDATMVTSTNAMPTKWKDGYILYTDGKWPTSEMTRNDHGVWSYTIPLPCGTYNYRFYVDGKEGAAVDDYTGAIMAWDPARRPLQAPYNDISELSEEDYLSSVYVPWDAIKQAHSANRPEEAPRQSQNGKRFVVHLTNGSRQATDFAVYLPFGFDASRKTPYPVLILMHGGGGIESSWINNGAAHIFDNMIAEGRMLPTVVICSNGSDLKWNRPKILNTVLHTILPYAEKNLNITKDPAQRAFAGLSMGGATTMYAYFHHTREFLYYLSMSAPLTEDVNPDYTSPLLKTRKLSFTMGQYDFVKRAESLYTGKVEPNFRGEIEKSIYCYIYGLKKAGIPFKTETELPYGHTWQLWRKNLVDWIDHFLWKQ